MHKFKMVTRELFYALQLVLMFLLALTPGISFTEDLGRHLLLGKIIVTTGHVPETNFLTYTHPDFPFVNHHWLSEVVFYFIHRAIGLNGLILFKALLMCAALFFAMRSVPLCRASPLIGFAATLATIALGYRAHIRPELFTYLGVALYGWLIARAERSPAHQATHERFTQASKLSACSWAVLIAYGWFWANAHIYFIFGIGMVFSYWLACWWRDWHANDHLSWEGASATARASIPADNLPKTDKRTVAAERDGHLSASLMTSVTLRRAWPRAETMGLLALIAISLLNPHGWRGLIYPLDIFSNYGIAITENISPLSYWATVLNPMLLALPFLSLCALWVFWRTLCCHNESTHYNLTTNYTDNTDVQTKGQRFDRIRVIRAIRGIIPGIIRIELSAGQLAGVLILLAALIATWFMARSAPLLALTLLPPLGFCIRAGTSKLQVGRILPARNATHPPATLARPPAAICAAFRAGSDCGLGSVAGGPMSRSLSDHEERTNNHSIGRTCSCPHFIKCGHVFWTGWLRGAGITAVIALNLCLAFAVVDGSYSRIFPSPIGPTPFGFDDESRYLELRGKRVDGLPLPIFSDYNSGSLVEYNIYPEPGYVDNRPEAFPAAFWQKEYGPALGLSAVWEEMIARRGIQTVAVSTAGVKEHFIRTLLADPHWQLVHLDFFFAVFTRDTPENQAFLRQHAFRQEQVTQFAHQIAQHIRALSSKSLWQRQVLADQIVYEIYALICLGANDLAWPLVWDMHLRYPDYQLIHELMRVSAPLHAVPAVMDVMERRARWPLAAKQVLDWGAVLEAQGRTDEARAVYRRGQRFFPLCPNLAI